MAAESSDRSCSSPELSFSRKRPRDNDVEDCKIKKSNCSPGSEGIYHFKILIPSVAAGAIIGKGGETIAQLQKDTNARIKMSKANDFYPGTTERVCLISGSTGSIMEVLDFITFKIREKPELNSNKNGVDQDTTKSSEREKQIKILVPNSTAGMIIGKGGNYIKKLKEESGAYVQISQKAKDQSLQERCITVIGDTKSNRKACEMMLTKIQEDSQSGSCLNVSYADMCGPVANFSPTGSPFAQPTGGPHHLSSGNNASTLNASIPWAGLSESAGLAGATLTLNLEPNNAPSQTVLSQIVSAITVALNNTAYPEHIKTEIANAIATLGKYRMLGVTWASPSPSYVGLQRLDPNPNGFFGQMAASVTTTRSVIDVALEPYRHPTSGTSSPSLLNNNAFLLGSHDGSEKSKEPRKVEVEIPERLVGAVLGEGGRSLAGVQEASGAVVQISKKGVFVPGTRNRLATISGSPPSIFIAHSLIQHRIAEEQVKRARHHN